MKPNVLTQRHLINNLGESGYSRGSSGDPSLEKNNGRSRAGQQRAFHVAHLTVAPDDLHITRHQGKRLALTMFVEPQSGDRVRTSRVASELITANPLNGDDVPPLQKCAARVGCIEEG